MVSDWVGCSISVSLQDTYAACGQRWLQRIDGWRPLRCLTAGLTATTLYDRTECYLGHSLTRIPGHRSTAYRAVFDGLRSSVRKRSPCPSLVAAARLMRRYCIGKWLHTPGLFCIFTARRRYTRSVGPRGNAVGQK